MSSYVKYEPYVRPSISLAVGKLAAFSVATMLALSFAPTVLAVPFVQDMGDTATGLVHDFAVNGPSTSFEVKTEQASPVAQDSANLGTYTNPHTVGPHKKLEVKAN